MYAESPEDCIPLWMATEDSVMCSEFLHLSLLSFQCKNQDRAKDPLVPAATSALVSVLSATQLSMCLYDSTLRTWLSTSALSFFFSSAALIPAFTWVGEASFSIFHLEKTHRNLIQLTQDSQISTSNLMLPVQFSLSPHRTFQKYL